MFGSITESTVLNACRILFGPDVELSRDFLHYLQLSGIKSAFRKRAKESHPDALTNLDPITQRHHIDRFRDITDAYKLICGYIKHRETVHCQRERKSILEEIVKEKKPHRSQPLFYNGQIPPRPLEIGRYLYYRGAIPYQALIQALGLQRRQRPSIGRIARSWGWLSGDGVNSILYCQSHIGRFGEKAEVLGLLNRFQINTLLNYQQTRQKKLGQYFVQMGYMTMSQLERMVLEMHHHNAHHPHPDIFSMPALSSRPDSLNQTS